MSRSFFLTTGKKRRSTRTFQFDTLESRVVMASNLIASLSGGVLRIEGTEGADNITVRQTSGNLSVDGIKISYLGSQIAKVSAGSVSRIEVFGLGGNDRILLNSEAVSGQQAIAISAAIHGGAGNDTIVGTSAADTIYGNDGDDSIWGGGGNDVLRGGNGNDRLMGGEGNDQLHGESGNDLAWGENGDDLLLGGDGNDDLMGGNGNDQLNGGAGIDRMWGEAGDDVLIGIDNGTTDYLEGGTGRDILWVDQVGSTRDRVVGLESNELLQSVASFANGADRTLNGDRLADPTALSGVTFRTFANNPLFSSSVPTVNDIRKGSLSDCYFLAGLGAIAKDNSFAIKQNIVDFNDGTYGVRLGDKFYRVDNDLAVTGSSTTPAYAKLGAQNSMWVAVIEKAFAHYRTGSNNFASIEGGWSVEINRAFRSSNAGAKNIDSYSSASALANDLSAKLNSRDSVTIGFTGEKKKSSDGGKLIMGHMYIVMSVSKNSAGAVTSVTLRNPWGTDGGAVVDSNPSDGLVTVSPDELFRLVGQVNWGRV